MMVVEKSGNLLGTGKRFGVVIGRFNEIVTKNLLGGVMDCLTRHGVSDKDVSVCWVPGSFEIPQAARLVADTNVDGVICVGALIRGDTPHFEVLASQVVKDISRVALESRKPVTFGVITADTQEQALERAGSKAGNKGWQAALSAIELASLWEELAP
jgi:6,7-dimethyl-8-ribityllumazine synthase